jgi:hypothetical protein
MFVFPRFEREGHTVDAVTQARWRGTVGEDVSKMSAAATAVHLSPHHAVASIDGRANGPFPRLEKARPPRAAFEFSIRNKERLAAARALERAGPVLREQGARSRRLGLVAPQYVVLLGRQDPTPFGVRLLNRKTFSQGKLSDRALL